MVHCLNKSLIIQNENYIKLLKSMLNVVKSSQKFHFGDAVSLQKISKLDEFHICFSNESYLKMPYKTVWFDYSHPVSDNSKHWNTKEAALIISIESMFDIITLTYDSESKMWFPPLLKTTFLIGGLTQRNKELLQIFNPGIDNVNIYKQCGGIVSPLIKMNGDRLSTLADEARFNFALVEKSLMLLNCKNIITEKIKAPEKLNKKRLKSNKLPIYDYHVLNIKIPGSKREYSEKQTPLSVNRVHLCRGHFKEYTKEHPLFGRHTGLYWWEPSVRGRNKEGVIVKDYSVKSM